MQQEGRVVGGRFQAAIEVFVAGDPVQVRMLGTQLAQQRAQRFDLFLRIRHRECLIAAVAPMRVAADVDQLDADRTRVVAEGVIGDARVGDEAENLAFQIDVVVPAVAGLRAGIVDALAKFARHRHVRQFRAVDHHEIDRRRRTRGKAFFVGAGANRVWLAWETGNGESRMGNRKGERLQALSR